MFNINNIEWYLIFCSSNDSRLLNHQGFYTLGACDINTHCIYIRDNLSLSKYKSVLIHELTHAIIASYNLKLLDYTEEIIADFMSVHGQEIISLANSIYEKTLKGNLF